MDLIKKDLYRELGWESLNNRRIMRKLSILHETYYYHTPSYLDDVVNKVRRDVALAVDARRPISGLQML